jgi:acyl carrier protein phosphodiesterase
LNYLAHAYLSFREPETLAGNMFSDFVKGKKRFDFPPGIQRGISLHRAIDLYTDRHPLTGKAKGFFRNAYGLYAGPFVDVAFDHFLARDPQIFPSGQDLASFAQTTYADLSGFETWFPGAFGRYFQYMRSQDWLYNYSFREGIYRSFQGLVRRAKYMHDHQEACSIFDRHYSELQALFESFFPSLREFAHTENEELRKGPGTA